MKVSYVSSQAISQALRHSLLRMQSELVSGQKEAQSGKVADVGLALGIRTGQAVSLARDVGRLESIVSSNTLVSSRLAATQDSLSRISEAGSTFLSALTAAVSGDSNPATTRQAGVVMGEALTGIVNSSFNGEHLFAGVNTDVLPLADYRADPPSAAKTAFDAAFLAHFGFAQDDPAATALDGPAIKAFLDGPAAAEFLGAGWEANWSSATDQGISTRIALNETVETSVSANIDGIRKLAMAATIVDDLYSSALNEGALVAVAETATYLVTEAMGDIAQVQAATGFTEQRIKSASEHLSMQVDIFNGFLNDMQGVDPFEAATRVNALISQIETSYALTARIQQLSLTRLLS
ncbi:MULTISPECIES: flagellar hook-associated family protein [Nitratireductor]|uniref:flagellar hook-associated family protein n=1 Tax=Nitratireductor TaxID=245876 RepID=UPI000D0D9730|nr:MULTISPECIES: flagellar hook-associated family protein [Nitratireductor]PSM18875.1 flagellar biosynthesis protein FlgL [Nitratireductor sp. StC3]